MEKRIRNIIGGLAALAFFSIMLYRLFISDDGNDRCQWQEEFDKKRYYGVITHKFYDHANHSVPKVILKNIGKPAVDTIDFLGDSSAVFDSLGKFDTIFKEAGTSEVFVRSDGQLKKIGKVVFGCKVNPIH